MFGDTIRRPDRRHVGHLFFFPPYVVLSPGSKQTPGLLKYLHKAVTLLDLFGVNIAFPGPLVSFVDRACQTSHKEEERKRHYSPSNSGTNGMREHISRRWREARRGGKCRVKDANAVEAEPASSSI